MNTGRAMSVPAGLALGAGVSVAATVVISLIGAQMIMNEILPQEQIGYCSMIALLAGTILGSVTASGKVKHRRIIICLLSGGIYLCILLAATALFFGGQYDGFWVTVVTVMVGCVASALLMNMKGEGRTKHRRKKF